MYRNCAKFFQWGSGRVPEEKKPKLDDAEAQVKAMFLKSTGLRIDSPTSQGGNTNSGNMSWAVFSTTGVKAVIEIVKFLFI